MRIYFVAAIAQRSAFGHFYQRIVTHLSAAGARVQADHVLDTRTLASLQAQSLGERQAHYKRVLEWIRRSQLVVVEASFPSTLNVGHEISLSLEHYKPTIVLYKQGHASLFLDGLTSDRLFLVEYTDDTLEQVLAATVEKATTLSDSRYHLHLSQKQMSYLGWIAKVKRMPRSVYMRWLLDAHRESNQEYRQALA